MSNTVFHFRRVADNTTFNFIGDAKSDKILIRFIIKVVRYIKEFFLDGSLYCLQKKHDISAK